MSRGYTVIPSSTKREHLAGNLGSTGLALSPDELAAIEALDAGGRLVDPDFAPRWD